MKKRLGNGNALGDTMSHVPHVVFSLVFGSALSGCVVPDKVAKSADGAGEVESSDTKPATVLSVRVYGVSESTDPLPIENATVHVRELGTEDLTDAYGESSVSSDRFELAFYTVNVEAIGYGPAARRILVSPGNKEALDIYLKKAVSIPVALPQPGEDPVSVSYGLAAVTFEAGDLVDQNGQPARGDVQVQVVPYDPTVDADWLPGEQLVNLGGTAGINYLRPYAMAEVTIMQGNEELSVAPERTVTLLLQTPAALREAATQSSAESPNAGCYWLNRSTGMWEFEHGLSSYDAVTGNATCEVSHFSAWNWDDYNTSNSECAIVTVLDESGNCLEGVHIRARTSVGGRDPMEGCPSPGVDEKAYYDCQNGSTDNRDDGPDGTLDDEFEGLGWPPDSVETDSGGRVCYNFKCKDSSTADFEDGEAVTLEVQVKHASDTEWSEWVRAEADPSAGADEDVDVTFTAACGGKICGYSSTCKQVRVTVSTPTPPCTLQDGDTCTIPDDPSSGACCIDGLECADGLCVPSYEE